jgi:hypothetical protein
MKPLNCLVRRWFRIQEITEFPVVDRHVKSFKLTCGINGLTLLLLRTESRA